MVSSEFQIEIGLAYTIHLRVGVDPCDEIGHASPDTGVSSLSAASAPGGDADQ